MDEEDSQGRHVRGRKRFVDERRLHSVASLFLTLFESTRAFIGGQQQGERERERERDEIQENTKDRVMTISSNRDDRDIIEWTKRERRERRCESVMIHL